MTISEDQFIADFIRDMQFDDSVVIPPGDDCAAIRWHDNQLMLLAVDQLAVNSHYLNSTDPELAGRKLLARNISDIAAMGGNPIYALLSIACKKDTSQDDLKAFARGIKELADRYKIMIIGGDLCKADSNVSSLTIAGAVDSEQVCLRSNAGNGDLLMATGLFGNSYHNGRHLTFEPRLNEALWLVEGRYTNCMIDVSDGLFKAGSRLAEASELKLTLDIESIAVNQDATVKQALTDGEDYELLFTTHPYKLSELENNWPFKTKLSQIGNFSTGSGVYDKNNHLLNLQSFDHFA